LAGPCGSPLVGLGGKGLRTFGLHGVIEEDAEGFGECHGTLLGSPLDCLLESVKVGVGVGHVQISFRDWTHKKENRRDPPRSEDLLACVLVTFAPLTLLGHGKPIYRKNVAPTETLGPRMTVKVFQ